MTSQSPFDIYESLPKRKNAISIRTGKLYFELFNNKEKLTNIDIPHTFLFKDGML